MKRVAIIGGGRMGMLRWDHICKASNLVQPLCIVEEFESLRNSLQAKGIPTERSLDAVLPKVNAIVICTPTASHKNIILKAAAAKVHVFCEKPLAYTAEEISECYEACANNNVILWVGWMKRYDPKFEALKTALGNEKWLHINLVNRDHPMPSVDTLCNMGDLWSDCAVHEFNLALWFSSGELPVAVQAFGSRSFNAGAVDRTTTLLTFADGRTINVENSRHSPEHRGYDQRIEVVTTTRSLRAEDNVGERYHSFGDRYAAAFQQDVTEFLQAVVQGGSIVKSRTSPEEDVATARIAHMALESHFTARLVPAKSGPLRLQFVGYGKFGRAIHQLLSGTPEISEEFTFLTPFRKSSKDVQFKDVIKSPSTEAVYICSPDSQHTEQAMAAIYAGKHVLVEKPVLNYSKVRMQAMSNAVVLMVGFQRRFADQFLAAKKSLVDSNYACKHLHVKSADPVAGEGDTLRDASILRMILMNSVVHDLDVVSWLLPLNTVYSNITVTAQPKCGVTITMEALPPRTSTPIRVTIDFHKFNPTYLQSVSVDEQWYGYDHTPIPRKDGQVWLDLYADAYAQQFKYFKKLVRGEAFDPTLPDTYGVSFQLLDRVLALVPAGSKL